MNVIGHQDKRQDKHRQLGSQRRYKIHPNTIVRFFRKPKTILQMIRGYKPDFYRLIHTHKRPASMLRSQDKDNIGSKVFQTKKAFRCAQWRVFPSIGSKNG